MSLLYNVNTQNEIKFQYIIWILLSALMIQQSQINLNQRFLIISILIIILRYLIMAIKRWHLPPLPIYKEITDLIIYISKKTRFTKN
jgi:hypothetical protein